MNLRRLHLNFWHMWVAASFALKVWLNISAICVIVLPSDVLLHSPSLTISHRAHGQYQWGSLKAWLGWDYLNYLAKLLCSCHHKLEKQFQKTEAILVLKKNKLVWLFLLFTQYVPLLFVLKLIESNNFAYAGLYYCSSTLAPEVDLFQTYSPYISTHSSQIDPAGYWAACYIMWILHLLTVLL